MSRSTCFAATALVSLLFVLVAQSSATAAEPAIENTNPIDWTIVTPFVGALGDDIPLRVGQADYTDIPGFILPGFGERHIIDGHGEVPPIDVIDEVLQDGTCASPKLGRFICTLDEAEVVFVRDVDARSDDDLPVGIISAYFRAPHSDD
jgi:hypothetical protein